jgi:Trk K+ transport system NAD-binding subunit
MIQLLRDRRLRSLQANWRDTLLLLNQFRWPLILFVFAISGGGMLYYSLARQAGEPVGNLPEAIYLVLLLTFLQPLGDFPQAWYLELFYFVMPVIGIGILAQGIADFGVSFFNRRTRSKEWEMAIASTFNNHAVLVGLGHLGYRVALQLNDMDQDVVVLEQDPLAHLVTNVRKVGVTVIQDDASQEPALEAAGIRRARSIILCTQNDSLNLQIAVKARSMNPGIKVIVRIFDEDFAQALHDQFGFIALSATGMAAPAFASAAAGVVITHPIAVDGNALALGRLTISRDSAIAGISVERLEQDYNLSVVMLHNSHLSDLHPPSSQMLSEGDVLAVLGHPQEITTLIHKNGIPDEM